MIEQNIQGPWLLARDFNAMLDDDEKKDGSKHGSCVCPLF